MRKLQITAGSFFLAAGLALIIGKKRYVQWSCTTKSRFLPSCYHGTLKEFADASPSVYLYWGITNALAGGLMLLSAFSDCCRRKES